MIQKRWLYVTPHIDKPALFINWIRTQRENEKRRWSQQQT